MPAKSSGIALDRIARHSRKKLGLPPFRLLQQVVPEPGQVTGQFEAIGPLGLAAAGEHVAEEAFASAQSVEGFVGYGELSRVDIVSGWSGPSSLPSACSADSSSAMASEMRPAPA